MATIPRVLVRCSMWHRIWTREDQTSPLCNTILSNLWCCNDYFVRLRPILFTVALDIDSTLQQTLQSSTRIEPPITFATIIIAVQADLVSALCVSS